MPRRLSCCRRSPIWCRGGFGIGFDLPRRPAAEPLDRLTRAVEGSETVCHLVRLSEQCGPHGRRKLCSMIERMPVPAREAAPRRHRG